MTKRLLIIAVITLTALTSCRPVYLMGGHTDKGCRPIHLPSNVRGWDYVGARATDSGYGEWYDRQGNLFGFALAEDSTIYKYERCLND